MKFVDTHAHVFMKEMTFVANARYTPGYDAPVTRYIENLDNNGFHYGLLIQPSFLGFDNAFMIEAIAQYPQRLKGVAVVPMDISLDELKQMTKQGIIGARLNLFGAQLPDLTTKLAKIFLNNLQTVNWHLELHCPPSYLVKLLPQLQAFNIQVVIDHFGRIDPIKGVDDPDYQASLTMLNPKQHWIKVSAYYRLGKYPQSIEMARQSYRILKDKGMLNRLIWGSDWPNTQHEHEESYEGNVSAFKKIVTNENEQILIYNENPINLLMACDK